MPFKQNMLEISLTQDHHHLTLHQIFTKKERKAREIIFKTVFLTLTLISKTCVTTYNIYFTPKKKSLPGIGTTDQI